jgi:hypothetical protein
MIPDSLQLIEEQARLARDDWHAVVDGYSVLYGIMAEAGIPVYSDGEGMTTAESGIPRDLADCLREMAAQLDLARRQRDEALDSLLQHNQAIPSACPITGEPFVGIERHPDHGWVALFGDEENAYTIPAAVPSNGDSDSEDPRSTSTRLVRQWLSREAGEWSEEIIKTRLIRTGDLDRLINITIELQDELKVVENRFTASYRLRIRTEDALREIVRAAYRRRAFWEPQIPHELVVKASRLCNEATG